MKDFFFTNNDLLAVSFVKVNVVGKNNRNKNTVCE
jgi:hypothetical protein